MSNKNFLRLFDANLLFLVVNWLTIYDVGVFDTACCDKSVRAEFLLCLYQLVYVKLPQCRSAWQSQKYLTWAFVRKLKIYHICLNTKQEVKILLEYLPKYANRLNYLRVLNLRSFCITASEASLLMTYLVSAPGLKSLDFSYDRLGDAGAASVCTGLAQFPNLHLLDIKWNSIGANGASCIAQGLLHTPLLRMLDIGCNGIGAGGATAIAESIMYIPLLESLVIGRNDIGDEGLCSIAKHLIHLPKLCHLDVCRNNVGEAGAALLADALRFTPLLDSLDISSNRIGNTGAVALAEGLVCNTSLRCLRLVNNDINADIIAAIVHPGLSIVHSWQ